MNRATLLIYFYFYAGTLAWMYLLPFFYAVPSFFKGSKPDERKTLVILCHSKLLPNDLIRMLKVYLIEDRPYP